MYRLAMDLGRTLEDMLALAQVVGLDVKSHLDTLEDAGAQALRAHLGIPGANGRGADDVAALERELAPRAPDVVSDREVPASVASEPPVETRDDTGAKDDGDAVPDVVSDRSEPASVVEPVPERAPEVDRLVEVAPEVSAPPTPAEADAVPGTTVVDAAPDGATADAAVPAIVPDAVDTSPQVEVANGEIRIHDENPALALMDNVAPARRPRTIKEQALLAERLEQLRIRSLGISQKAAAERERKHAEDSKKALPDAKGGKKPPKKGSNAIIDLRNRLKSRGEATVERKSAIEISLPITIKDLSQAIGVPAGKIIGYLHSETGSLIPINAHVEADLVQLIGLQFEKDVVVKQIKAAEEHIDELMGDIEAQRGKNLQPRPPVIVVLGHVDHGKTSILDRIRSTNVTAGEAGGITQHLSAWQVERDGKTLTFIDTPGHAAFTAMRARGAHVTDIVVLVVAADDGVMPQTEEAINHARAAKTPIIVALNKIDKPNAAPEKAMQQLANLGLQSEEWGGDTIIVPMSAQTGVGINELLEAIDLLAELLELQANPTMRASGVVLEAKKDEGLGNVATLLVKEGSIHKGDALLAGLAHGKVRSLVRGFGGTRQQIDVAGPGMPIEITGLIDVPDAGDRFFVVDSMAKARDICEERQRKDREIKLAGTSKNRLDIESLFKSPEEGGKVAVHVEQLDIIVKADVKGTLEVLRGALQKLDATEVKVKIIHSAIGGVTESDVLLASASETTAMILAFNVTAEDRARQLAEEKRVAIRPYTVIYELLDDVKKSMEGLLAPDLVESYLGTIEVRKLFKSSKLGTIAGCMVTRGLVRRTAKIKLSRDGVIVKQGFDIDSLKRIKDDVREVKEGFDCGIRLRNFDDLKEGDVLEAYEINEVARTLE